MIKGNKTNKTLPYFLIVMGLFLFLVSPCLLSYGMFCDGTIYANISYNMSIGEGNLWNPIYSHGNTWLSDFNGHPTLAMWLQSIFFSLFEDFTFTEKIYSLLMFLICGYLIHLIWRKLGLRNSFVALLFFFSMPLVFWAATNNLLENTLMVFTTLAVLFYFTSLEKQRYVFLILSGFSLFAGMLCKGFTALFPWALPILYSLVMQKTNIKRAFVDTFIIILATLSPLAILLITNQNAYNYITEYLNLQIFDSMITNHKVNNRFYILTKYFGEMIISLIALVIFYVVLFFKNKELIAKNKEDYKKALFLFLFSLCGVIPIMITLKQSGFYMLAALPFLAMSLASIANTTISNLINKQKTNTKSYLCLKVISIIFFLLSITTCLLFTNKYSRDKTEFEDIKVLSKYIPENTIVSIPSDMLCEMSLISYLYRYHLISLDASQIPREFLLINRKTIEKKDFDGYERVEIKDTKQYDLYKRK